MERPVPRLSARPGAVVGRLVFGALAVIAILPLRPLLQDAWHLVLASVGAAVAVTISGLLSPRRPFALSLLAGVGALIVGAVAVLLSVDVPVPELLAALAELPAAWNVLVTAELPAPPTPQALVLPVGGTAIAAYLAAEVAARTRWLLLAAAPPMALLVVGLLVLGRHGPPAPATIGAFVAGVLMLAGIERVDLRPSAAALLVLTVAVATGAIASRASSGARVDLRDGHQTAVERVTAGDPLGDVGAAWADENDQVVFRVAFDQPPAGDGPVRLRVATLDSYTGRWWQADRSFTAVGNLLPRHYAVLNDGLTVQTITLTNAYPGPFLPALASPSELRGSVPEGLRYDREIGDLVLTGRSPGGVRYEVLSPASPAATPDLDEDERRRLTALPDAIPDALQREVANLPRPTRARADALAERIRRGDWALDRRATPGHSLARLESVIHHGAATIEQPAALFSVLARSVDLPARVVVGYEVPRERGELAVHAGQMWVWAEVHVPGEGWISYDVTPREPRPSARPDEVPIATTTTTPSVPGGRQPTPATTLAPAPARDPELCPAGACDSPGQPRSLPWPVALIAGVVALPAAIVAIKRLRRWLRQHRASPTGRLGGAWQESAADLRAHGIALPPGMTTRELAKRTEPPLDPVVSKSLARWGHVLDTAVFAPTEPGHDLADEAWTTQATLAAALRSTASRPRRLVIAIDPRPLVRR